MGGRMIMRRRVMDGDLLRPAQKTVGPSALVSVTDARQESALDVTIGIEPVQDLHGYDHPWPAGGGKNLLPNTATYPSTKNGVTFTKNANGTVSFSGTTTLSDFSFEIGSVLLDAGEYILSGAISNTKRLRVANGSTLIGHDSGSGFSFTLSEAATVSVSFRITEGSDVAVSGTFSPMIRLATVTDATYAPYSNICPITGWTGANVVRARKNLLPNIKKSQSVNAVTIGQEEAQNSNQKIYLPAGTYTLSATTTVMCSLYSRTASSSNFRIGSSAEYPYGTFTVDKGDYYAFWLYSSNGISESNITSFQLELGSTATAYEPYQGETYSITFPSEAGTVYGGTLDVVNGVLTVDRAQITSYAGETLPGTWISDRDAYAAGATPTTGAQVVYELATPITYQLTPQQVALLLGSNTISADTGDTTLTYLCGIPIILSNL